MAAFARQVTPNCGAAPSEDLLGNFQKLKFQTLPSYIILTFLFHFDFITGADGAALYHGGISAHTGFVVPGGGL
jgi:hypothetical protein